MLFKNNIISEKHTILFGISAVALDKESDGVKKLLKTKLNLSSTELKKIMK